MNIHELKMDLGGASSSINECSTIEICKICSIFCERILAYFVRVTLKDHPSERSYIHSSSILIKWYWSMLERIISNKTGMTPPKIRIHAITGLNMADQCNADIVLAFKTFFNLDESLIMQEMNGGDPILLIQLLTLTIDGCIEKLKERLHTHRETSLMSKCITKVHQVCENIQFITDAVLCQYKPFPERQTRLYVVQLKLEFIR
jgi:hypothetical protein